ncbi:hypothetical protein F2Q68_00017040 [Brassica cretica]|uniref:Uncharacterized protein n=1 Tax=Brassica cretica TaxID=69181 RepID=A0A8S9HLH1_BRACR|nr:hypothetical protein F2Q68_00017040 [Brassica cretica]
MSATHNDHQDYPGTSGPEKTTGRGIASSTKETNTQRWSADICKNTYSGNTRGAKSNHQTTREPEPTPKPKG